MKRLPVFLKTPAGVVIALGFIVLAVESLISRMIKDSTASTIKPNAITTPAGVFKNTGNLFILLSPIPAVQRRRGQASKPCPERNRRVCPDPCRMVGG